MARLSILQQNKRNGEKVGSRPCFFVPKVGAIFFIFFTAIGEGAVRARKV